MLGLAQRRHHPDEITMATKAELEAKIAAITELMLRNLQTQAEVDDPEPYGEDSNMDSFDYGKPYGADDVAVEALEILGVKYEREEGDRYWDEEGEEGEDD
jgi:hypothetical protein